MEGSAELQAKFDWAQAQVEKGVVHITRQKALIAHRLDHGGHLVQPLELLATLEETQRLHVTHRDRLGKELVGALFAERESELHRLSTSLLRRHTINDELRRKNARLRDQISEVVKEHQELRDLVDQVALKQGLCARVGVPFLNQVQDDLRERALAVIAAKSELLDRFSGLLS
jgi:hypothetical protein